MHKIAKLFKNGRSQAVRLPSSFRFSSREVYIRKDSETGDVILSRKPESWDDLFALADATDIPPTSFDRPCQGTLSPPKPTPVSLPPLGSKSSAWPPWTR